MKYNDNPGVAKIVNTLKDKWNYLRIGNMSATTPFPTAFGSWGTLVTTYDGSYVTGALGTVQATSVTSDSTSFTRSFQLGFLDYNGVDINTIFDATTDTGTTVDSYEALQSFNKTNIDLITITVKTEIIR